MCAPCKDENIKAAAPWYCQQCDDNLCEDCRNSHKKIKATRNLIVLQNVDDNDEFLLAEVLTTQALESSVTEVGPSLEEISNEETYTPIETAKATEKESPEVAEEELVVVT